MHKLKVILMTLVLLLSSLPFITEAEAKGGIVNPNKVYTYKQMVKDINTLKKAYPDQIQVKVIGKSEYGRKIYAVGLGKGQANLFINGSHHAREWMTTSLNMYMIENYAAAYTKKQKIQGYDAKKILNSTTIWFVPMVNPDGVTLQQYGLKAFPKKTHKSLIKMNEGSKNFKRWKANGKGIDLNRQYNAGWKEINSPAIPKYKNFKGYAPESAAETKAILKFVADINPEMAISYHSTGKILYWNWKQPKANYKRDYQYAKQIGKMTGYSLVFAGKNPSGGGFTDWFIHAKQRPAFTPEISKAYYETSPPLSEFPGAWKENQAVGLYAANESAKLKQKRIETESVKLEKKLKTLHTKAKGLKTYYYAIIKQENDVKLDKKHKALYNSITAESNNLAREVSLLPAKNRKKLSGYFSKINYYTNKSTLFMDSVSTGENLITAANKLDLSFTQGKLDDVTLNEQKVLKQSYANSENKINKMYGKLVRKLSKSKYVLPAKFTADNTQLEIDRYTLSLSINDLIKNGKIEDATTSLVKLNELEKKSKTLKQNSPSKYKTYPKIEEKLIQMKQFIEEELKNAQEPLTEQLPEE
ncbi:M14 family zinc carboxypeptidase [Mesobacillus thioparans]|uniref:M14 family zinc carboxypeptidase n=1 Tax=Mesobacillus thioparans TaxID=370439 RepID=UPI0039EE5850